MCRQFENLVVPLARRKQVLEMAHGTSHFGGRKTAQRVLLTGLTWCADHHGNKSLRQNAVEYAGTCSVCQLVARKTKFDRVPIKVVERTPIAFQTLAMDVFGELVPGEKLRYNHALIIVCMFTRYPFCFPLSAVTIKNIADCLLKVFELVGLANELVLVSDNATYFKSKLMVEFQKRLNITPRISTPYHSEGNSTAERHIGWAKSIIAKLAMDHRNNWHVYLGPTLWCMRETVNATTGLAPFTLVFGSDPVGPLRLVKEHWTGEINITPDLNVDALKYLTDLKDRLLKASEYAVNHSSLEQLRYVRTYNKTARNKSFSVGDKCLILQKDDLSSSTFAKWKGPATIVKVLSPHSYHAVIMVQLIISMRINCAGI